MNHDAQNELLTEAEAANLLRWKQPTLRRRRMRGLPPAYVKFGASSSVRYLRSDLELSRPTLYRWFPSKDVLLEAFGRREMTRFDQGIAAALEGIDK